jgi:hypothetical protein
VDAIITLWDAILDSLREMGNVSVRQGKPYGLRGYPDYYRERFPGSFRKSAWEEPLTAGVKLGLEERGFLAKTEWPYGTGERCDLVVDLSRSKSVWIECKAAFRQCLGKPKPGSPYDYNYDGDNWYDPGRGSNSWVEGVADIARKDVPKLLSLSSIEAQYTGVLLLGFDLQCAPLTNEELDELLRPCLDEWKPAHGEKEGATWDDSYPIRKELGFRERVWFWYRPVAEHTPNSTVDRDASAASAPELGAKRRAALAVVARFCSVPYRQHGGLQKSGPYEGWYKHDWGHLVQEVNAIYGATRLSIFGAGNVGNQVRRRFANACNWDAAVNSPGAHEMILDIILSAIMPHPGTNMS